MEVANGPTAPGAVPRVWLAGLVLALAFGAVLRLAWVKDIEYKADEEWTFRQAREAARGGPWPRLGMPVTAPCGLAIERFGVLAIIARRASNSRGF